MFLFFFWGGRVGSGGGGVRVDVNGEVKFFVKIQKKKYFFLGGSGWGGQGRCERRSEFFMKIPQKNGGSGRVGFGGQEGWGWGRVWGRVRGGSVNRELNFCENSKNNWGSGRGKGVRFGGGGSG